MHVRPRMEYILKKKRKKEGGVGGGGGGKGGNVQDFRLINARNYYSNKSGISEERADLAVAWGRG